MGLVNQQEIFLSLCVMVAKHIPCYHCGNKHEDVDVCSRALFCGVKVVGLRCRATLLPRQVVR